MRAFVAIHPPPGLRAQLERLQQHLRHKIPPQAVRWTRPEQLHVTLLFLGAVDDTNVPEISRRLKVVAATHSAAQWQLDHVGCFPNMKQPNVVWVGSTQAAAALLQLQRGVNSVLGEFAERDEHRAFHPHVTLGRAKPNASSGVLQRLSEELQRCAPALPLWPVNSICLMQSQLNPNGAVHSVVAEFPLQT